MSIISREAQEKIRNHIGKILEKKGICLIEFKIFPAGKKSICRCLIDYPEGGITIDECANINNEIFSFLEETSLLGEDFVVEVNSPGMDRPLKTKADFLRVKGRNVGLWLSESIEGKSYIEGKVIEMNQEKLIFNYKDKDLEIDLTKIKLGKEKIEI
jgi:ribosome maturation factor RimP